MCNQQRLRPDAQSDQSLCYSLEYSMIVKLLTEHHLELLNLKAAAPARMSLNMCKMPNCWISHVAVQMSGGIFPQEIYYFCRKGMLFKTPQQYLWRKKRGRHTLYLHKLKLLVLMSVNAKNGIH